MMMRMSYKKLGVGKVRKVAWVGYFGAKRTILEASANAI